MASTLPIVLTQHAEEAAFLWHLRADAIGQPHYDRPSLNRLDSRLEAHLDGLAVAGDAGWQFALEQLDAHPEPGETFACAFLGFAGGNQARIARVLQAAADPANLRGVVSALGWIADDRRAEDYVLQLGLSSEPLERRIGIAVAAIRRVPPGPVLQKALTDKDAGVAARAARAVGELGAANLAGMLRPLLSATDLDSRFWAAWSLGLLVGESSALGELRTIALIEKSYRRRAVDLICRRAEPRSTLKWLPSLEATPGGKRLIVQALGTIGDPDAVPRLLEYMKDPPLSRVAGEAFSFITGVHLSYDKLDTDPPEGFQTGPTEDPADEDVALDPDGNLYWPDSAKCAAWWSKNRANFTAGTRYLVGKTMTPDNLRDVLRNGYQRQRIAAALELSIRQPGQPLFEVRRPGFRQRVE